MRARAGLIALVAIAGCASSTKTATITTTGPTVAAVTSAAPAVQTTTAPTTTAVPATTPVTPAPTTTSTTTTTLPPTTTTTLPPTTTTLPATTVPAGAAIGVPFTYGDYTLTIGAPVPSALKPSTIDPPGSHLVTVAVSAIYNGAKTGNGVDLTFDIKLVGSDHSLYDNSTKFEQKDDIENAKDAIAGGKIAGNIYYALPADVTAVAIRLDPGFGNDVITIPLAPQQVTQTSNAPALVGHAQPSATTIVPHPLHSDVHTCAQFRTNGEGYTTSTGAFTAKVVVTYDGEIISNKANVPAWDVSRPASSTTYTYDISVTAAAGGYHLAGTVTCP